MLDLVNGGIAESGSGVLLTARLKRFHSEQASPSAARNSAISERQPQQACQSHTTEDPTLEIPRYAENPSAGMAASGKSPESWELSLGKARPTGKLRDR
jgi:hypothetical protein